MQNENQAAGSHVGVDDFESRAAQVLAQMPEEFTPGELPADAPADAPAEAPAEKRFIVSDAMARAVVQMPFEFVAEKTGRVEWLVSDAECETAPRFLGLKVAAAPRPAMQTVLQNLADKWMPEWLARIADTKSPELALVGSMLALGLAKFLAVQAAAAQEAMAAASAQPTASGAAPAMPRVEREPVHESAAGDVEPEETVEVLPRWGCEKGCGAVFPSRAEMEAHSVGCNGAPAESGAAS